MANLVDTVSGIFKSQVRSYVLIPVIGLSVLITVLIIQKGTMQPATTVLASKQDCATALEMLREDNFKFTKPLLTVDMNLESSYLNGMKSRLTNYIQTIETGKQAQKISVYFRRLKDGAFFTINPGQVYNPASMAKIILLITYLKEAEDHPDVLNRKIFFSTHFTDGNQANIVSFQLKENSHYTVKQLLEYMIIHSDNDATVLLSQQVNTTVYNKVFSDLKVPAPPQTKTEYYISVSDFAKFLRVLYNASYIDAELSEYGLNLLSMCDFNDGLKKGIDPSVSMAHKFGERVFGGTAQLHEFGIVYYDHDPYMIGVMSEGSNLKDLSNIMGEISRIASQEFKVFSNG